MGLYLCYPALTPEDSDSLLIFINPRVLPD
jgi:hypothetical protein